MSNGDYYNDKLRDLREFTPLKPMSTMIFTEHYTTQFLQLRWWDGDIDKFGTPLEFTYYSN